MICVPDGRISLSGTTYFILPARTEAVDSAVLHHLFHCSPHGLSRLGHHGHHAISSACQTGSALVLDVSLA